MDSAVLLAGMALILAGFMMLVFYLLRMVGRGQVRGGGFSVILIGPIPVILRGGLRASLLTLLLAAILLILALYFFGFGHG
ncbi:hypothetical protein HRbin01_01396 [archaeon HR01]|nr:hypothetical protein HRbin01_01396 [archaeon HR01]